MPDTAPGPTSGRAPITDRRDPAGRTRAGSFVVYIAFVVTAVMLLFPPFSSLNGTEYAFFATGPEWSRGMGRLADELGLTARVYWPALLVQLVAVWALALGARRLLLRGPRPPGQAPH